MGDHEGIGKSTDRFRFNAFITERLLQLVRVIFQDVGTQHQVRFFVECMQFGRPPLTQFTLTQFIQPVGVIGVK